MTERSGSRVEPVEEVSIYDPEEARMLAERLGHEQPDIGNENNFEAKARYWANSEADMSRAFIYNDEITVEVDLEMQLEDETENYTGFLTDNAYSVFEPWEGGSKNLQYSGD